MPVALLTDFGTADYFVGAMKGVILATAPDTRIIDITHQIPPQDIQAAAFTLLAAYPAFPPASVHVVVVDPGVGSERRPIVVEAGEQIFVGPDNGVFGYVLDREAEARAYRLDDSRFFRHPVSATFHGRDIFAPVAAALAAGAAPAEMGPPVAHPVRLPPLRPSRGADGTLQASIIHVDHFGNCITSITRDDWPAGEDSEMELRVGGSTIRSVRRFYAEAGAARDEVFAIWGSAGFLEISVDGGSAEERLGIRRGAAVRLRFGAAD
jgi:S-adenosyl-L-methionine hydrolase (adenosine-forming)